MTTRPRNGPLVTVPLDPAAAAPLFRQLYEGLRRGILDGTLALGVRRTAPGAGKPESLRLWDVSGKPAPRGEVAGASGPWWTLFLA